MPLPVQRYEPWTLILQFKGGNAGKWKTSYQATKSAQKFEMGTSLAVDDQGIWVTFARGMRPKAMKEFKELCEKVRGRPQPIGFPLRRRSR